MLTTPSLRLLTQPAILVLIAANAVPILGILFWHWDAFLLLLLYWMETAVVGFWTLWLIRKAPDRTIGSFTDGKSPAAAASVIAANAGVFMVVHFVFLWVLFSDPWKSQVHNPVQFISVIVIGQGLWAPLLVLFVARGIEPVLLVHGPEWYRRKQYSEAAKNPWLRGGLLYALYARIIVMQLAIIISGFFISFLGGASALAPLILLIVIKTAIDLGLFLSTGFDAETKDG